MSSTLFLLILLQAVQVAAFMSLLSLSLWKKINSLISLQVWHRFRPVGQVFTLGRRGSSKTFRCWAFTC
jgi:hypothetical protein